MEQCVDFCYTIFDSFLKLIYERRLPAMDALLNSYKEALEKNRFTVRCFASKEEAAADFLKTVEPGCTVGFGGSVTTRELGLPEALKQNGVTIYSHWEVPEGSDKAEQLFKAMTSDIYVCSANAITKDGKIVNIDGTGNRLAALLFGHKAVFLFVGKNKLSGTYEEAMARIKCDACVPNAKRLNKQTPCALAGKCADCASPDRICNATLILEKNPNSQPIFVYLIDEPLGY